MRVPKVAVILAGCGHMDGSEVREAVFALLALDQHGAQVQCLAPRGPQAQVGDHLSGRPVEGARRDMLEEASRISRAGQCMDLAGADPRGFDALVIPGGKGVARNLCSFDPDGPAASVRPDVSAFIRAFLEAGKPVGAICIAPALVALALNAMGRKATLTLGRDTAAAAAMERLGLRHQAVGSARNVVVDEANNLVTTPAYMFDDARTADVWTGIERCVGEVLRRVGAAVS